MFYALHTSDKVVKCQNESFQLSEVRRKQKPKRTIPVRLTVLL